MKQQLLSRLCCPSCKGDLDLAVTGSETVVDPASGTSFEELLEGEIRCAGCGKKYPLRGGIPRFVPSDSYVDNFSVQWRKLRASTKTRPSKVDRALEHFQARTDFDLSKVRGEWVLEAGSGGGRYVKLLADAGAEIVGVDLSFGVDEVFKLVGRRPNVHVIQASIFDLPFKDAAFDKVYSLGVLHHTPSTKKAFDCLPRLLKPGGRIAVWVYSRHDMIPWKFGQIYRKITTRLPPRLLYYLCYAAVPLHYVYKIPLLGRLAFIVLRTDGHHPDRRFRVLNTFDFYAPKYQFLHTYSEVFGWLEEHGLEKIRILPAPVAVSGSRPVKTPAVASSEEPLPEREGLHLARS